MPVSRVFSICCLVALAVLAVLIVPVMLAACARLARVNSEHRRGRRAAAPVALVIVDPRLQRVDLLVHQVVVLRSAVAHSGNVVHRQDLLCALAAEGPDRKSTRLNSRHVSISYA